MGVGVTKTFLPHWSVAKEVRQDYRGYIRVYNGKENGNYYITISYWGYIGVYNGKMETTVLYWDYIGIIYEKISRLVKDLQELQTGQV